MTKKWAVKHYDPRGLDYLFYEALDVDFLPSKAYLLYEIIKHFDEAKSFYAKFQVNLDSRDVERLSAEIYFTQFQQFEALFALLLAGFQELPHWLYLTQYRTSELKESVKAFMEGQIERVTGGRANSEHEFISKAVYSGFAAPESEGDWSRNLENILWMLNSLGGKYLDGVEYNAYKHGLRVLTGPSEFTFSVDNESPLSTTWTSDNTVTFLEVLKHEGQTVLQQTAKHFDPEEAVNYLYFMNKMVGTIRATRLARIGDDNEVTIATLFELDKTRLSQLRSKYFKWSVVIGELTDEK